MMDRIYFRVERKPRGFEDPLRGTGRFLNDHPPQGAAMESLLEERRPVSKSKRAEALFVFEELECAIWHWAKARIRYPEARVYRVTVIGMPLHRGDMKIINQLSLTTDEGLRNGLADKYWQSAETANPCIEALVNGATIVEEVPLTDQDAKAAWTKQGITRYAPGKEDIHDLIFLDKPQD
jgi:hypothetical protein